MFFGQRFYIDSKYFSCCYFIFLGLAEAFNIIFCLGVAVDIIGRLDNLTDLLMNFAGLLIIVESDEAIFSLIEENKEIEMDLKLDRKIQSF